MNEIKRADRNILLGAIFNPFRLLGLIACGYVSFLLAELGGVALGLGIAILAVALGMYAVAIRNDYVNKRFKNQEHKHLWDMVEDRLSRLRGAVKLAPDHVKSSMNDLPIRVERTAKQLYQSLRRADIVRCEILRSEGSLATASFPFQVSSPDTETTELYVLADKNVAEYKRHYLGIQARVTRTEGQCAVFISALDSMRVQILGHRLVGDSVPSEKQDFLQAMSDISAQLNSINIALTELNLPVSAPASTIQEVQEQQNLQG